MNHWFHAGLGGSSVVQSWAEVSSPMIEQGPGHCPWLCLEKGSPGEGSSVSDLCSSPLLCPPSSGWAEHRVPDSIAGSLGYTVGGLVHDSRRGGRIGWKGNGSGWPGHSQAPSAPIAPGLPGLLSVQGETQMCASSWTFVSFLWYLVCPSVQCFMFFLITHPGWELPEGWTCVLFIFLSLTVSTFCLSPKSLLWKF